MRGRATCTYLPSLVMLITSLVFAGCDMGPSSGIPTNIVFPDRNVSYLTHVQPLFDASCAVSGCHDEFSQEGGLQLRTYFDLFRTSGLVLPGDSLRSILSQVMSERLPHTRRAISFITNLNHRRGVSLWIHEGALNN